MTPPIAYDATRLFLGPLSRTPRGIDRVDLAFAEHIFRGHPNALAVLPTPWGVRCFGPERVLPGLERLRALWAEATEPEADPVYLRLRARLLGGAVEREPQPTVGRSFMGNSLRLLSLLRATGVAPGASVTRAVPQNAFYLSIGHLGLVFPILLRWLDRRPDVTPVFMLHDAIPIESPEYVEPEGVRGHLRMMDAAARYARGLIATTQTARASVDAQLAARGRARLPAFVRALPPGAAFTARPAADPSLADCSYFIACATLEPRKNLELLGEVWKRLCAERGDLAPHLVIVGAKGWRGDQIAARLARAPSTANRLHLVHGLSTPALARLLAGARAVLSPSFTEGFGLPVAEALALGAPVIASDIASHREIARDGVTLVDPLDGPAWKAAVERALAQRPHVTPSRLESWPDYFAAWAQDLEGLRRSQPSPAPQEAAPLPYACANQPLILHGKGGGP